MNQAITVHVWEKLQKLDVFQRNRKLILFYFKFNHKSQTSSLPHQSSLQGDKALMKQLWGTSDNRVTS